MHPQYPWAYSTFIKRNCFKGKIFILNIERDFDGPLTSYERVILRFRTCEQ